MGIKIIVGGQFGGEGKGKVSHFFAKKDGIDIVVRVGGSNSGHTVIDEDGEKFILRQLPTPSIIKDTKCIIAAGAYIDTDLLFKEKKLTGLMDENLIIDENAMVISLEDRESENAGNLRKEIGSTLSGTGASVVRRISRYKNIKLAKDTDQLKPFITDTKKYLNDALMAGKDILIEGTQGFGLSLLHSPFYPFTTSRDTTAAAFLSEAGLSPLDVDEIILVIRTYPIRVEGNSGKLKNEISWEEINQNPELSSVTRKERRVAEFDAEIVKQAILANKPTSIVMNHLDYIKTEKREEFILFVSRKISREIHFLGLSDDQLYKV